MLEPDVTMTSNKGELLKGKIKFISDHHYHLIFQGQLIKAQLAFSCLLTPIVDDEVLLFKEVNDYYILSIIHRHKTAELSIKLGQNVSLVSENNCLKVNAQTIRLIADDTIHSDAPSHHIDGEQGIFAIKNAQFSGDELKFSYQSLQMICHRIQTFSDTINTQAIRVYQWIEELEHQLLGRLRTIVKHHYRIDCDEIEIYAEGDAKIAAKQIQLG